MIISLLLIVKSVVLVHHCCEPLLSFRAHRQSQALWLANKACRCNIVHTLWKCETEQCKHWRGLVQIGQESAQSFYWEIELVDKNSSPGKGINSTQQPSAFRCARNHPYLQSWHRGICVDSAQRHTGSILRRCA